MWGFWSFEICLEFGFWNLGFILVFLRAFHGYFFNFDEPVKSQEKAFFIKLA
jgi:hypothetical protein